MGVNSALNTLVSQSKGWTLRQHIGVGLMMSGDVEIFFVFLVLLMIKAFLGHFSTKALDD